MSNPFHIHLVSDSTGETVNSIVRSVMSQFEGVEYEEHTWSLVRTKGQMERVIKGIRQNPGIVMYTIINHDLQDELSSCCREIGVPCVPVLARAMRELSSFIGMQAKDMPGRQHELDEEYFKRVEAVDYTLSHDDGASTDDLEKADVVLVGVSRTSKTPTCVYLAYRGISAANIPYVKSCLLPDSLFNLNKPLVVGLVISPERLIQIRKSRLVSLNESRDTDYVDMEKIKEEVLESKKLFLKHKWPVIDVTRKSVEETTAVVMQYHKKHIVKQHE